MSESNGQAFDPTVPDLVATLKDKIAKQKQYYKVLETDVEHPQLVEQQIATLTEVVNHLPSRLDAEIEQAKQHLAHLIAQRDCRIADKTKQLSDLVHRRDNLQDMYIQAWDDLQAMNTQLKRLEHNDALEKLRQLQAAAKALQAELPEHLRKLTKEELLNAEIGE